MCKIDVSNAIQFEKYLYENQRFQSFFNAKHQTKSMPEIPGKLHRVLLLGIVVKYLTALVVLNIYIKPHLY